MAAFAKSRPNANTSPSVPTGPQFDNRRIAAGLIDLMVPLGLGVLAWAAGLSLTLGVLVVVMGWGLYYCFALETSDGQTLGKKAMKLRVVSVDGSPASDTQIAKRTIVRILDWGIIGLIAMLVSGERRQRLGDMLANTVVTDAAASAAPAAPQFDAPQAPEMPGPAAQPAAAAKPKARRSLKDLAKLEIGGSKKKKQAEAQVAPATATAVAAGPRRLPPSPSAVAA